MTISLCTLLTIIMIFSTFLRFLRLPIRSRVRRPKLWVSTGFKSSSQKCQNMNCGGLKKNFGGIFLFIFTQVGLECCIHDSSFQFIDLWAPWEDQKFWDWPQAKNSLVWRQGSVVILALSISFWRQTIGRHQHKSAAPVHKIPISQWSRNTFFLFHCCQKPASLISEMVCNTNL